jgi:diguanylate cyclase (GGDEF)-like protein
VKFPYFTVNAALSMTKAESGVRMMRIRSFFIFLLVLFSILPVHHLSAQQEFQPLSQALVALDRNWAYRWGDSPFDAGGVPLWTCEQGNEQAWTEINFPSNPPERQERTRVWFRTRLPDFTGPDPRLFIYSIDLAAEVYLESRRIYAYGDLEPRGRALFQGWPWHLIPLPDELSGKQLYIRVFSDYRDIGLWGEAILGSGADHMRRIIKRDIVRIVVAVISLTLSSIFLLMYFLRDRQRSFLYLCLITLALVIRVISETQIKQLILQAPLFFEYVKAISYFVLPLFIILFLQEILGEQYRRVTRMGAAVVLGLLAFTMIGCATGLIRLCDTYLLFDIVAICTMIFLGILSVKAAAAGNVEARLVCFNFIIFGLLALYSILVTNGVFPWTDEINYLLLFQFSLGLAVILIRRLVSFSNRLEEYSTKLQSQSEELTMLNQSLEEKVRERTRQLELANRQLREEKITLQITSITDGLTGVYNRTYALERYDQEIGEAKRYRKKLSVIMFDLDHFKRVNDFYGHQIGDSVLQQVAQIFRYTMRDSDLIGRYGGEEFLIVLPETDCMEAELVAERIRKDVETQEWSDPQLHVTISGGVAEYSGGNAEQLIRRADSLMYQAKQLGRNRIVSETTMNRRSAADAG